MTPQGVFPPDPSQDKIDKPPKVHYSAHGHQRLLCCHSWYLILLIPRYYTPRMWATVHRSTVFPRTWPCSCPLYTLKDLFVSLLSPDPVREVWGMLPSSVET